MSQFKSFHGNFMKHGLPLAFMLCKNRIHYIYKGRDVAQPTNE